MPTPFPAQRLADEVVRTAVDGSDAEWRAAVERLAALDGAQWLLLDAAVRSCTRPAPHSGWWPRRTRHPLAEPSGFIASVRAMDADGHVRQHAVDTLVALVAHPGPVRAAVLALRALDHVPQVREAALRGLAAPGDARAAAAALDVLLAGERRQHAPAALAAVRAALTRDAATDLLMALTGSARRSVRRWAFEVGHEQRLLPRRLLRAVAGSDPDQLLTATCAGWLLDAASGDDVVALLRARSAEVRAIALTRVPDGALGDAVLLPVLADRAPRLREVAQWRARRRGLDVAAWYRARLAEHPSPRVRAACLDGLRRFGGPADLPVLRAGLDSPSPSVRVAAARGVGAFAPPAQVRDTIGPLLLDPSPRVSATAVHVLAQARSAGAAPDPEVVARAWASVRPGSRRSAWRLDHGAGGWRRVEADLRAAADPDPQLAGAGRGGVGTWLADSAATTWDVLDPQRRERIRGLLGGAALPEHQRRALAFHAGIAGPDQGA